MNYIKKIYKWLPFFLSFIPFKILSFIPNKKNILLFGTGTGVYHDNSKYLFQYFLENKENYDNYEVYWVAKNKKVYIHLKNKNYPVVKFNSLFLIFLASKAKSYFITAEIFDIFWFINDSTKLIQLWHGVPIKYIGYDYEIDVKNILVKKKYFSKNYLYDRFDYLIIDDEKYREIFHSAFRIDKQKIKTFGQPRNEIFINSSSILKKLNLEKYDKVMLYAPTHRKNEKDNILLLKKLLTNEAKEFLQKNNYCLLLKLHPFVSNLNILTTVTNENIINMSQYDDIQELLSISDAAITDISSWAIDYLLFKNNLYLFFPDITEYKKDRYDFYSESYDILMNNSVRIKQIDEIKFDIIKINKNLPCKSSSKTILDIAFD